MKLTDEKLAAMSVADRSQLYANAVGIDSEAARELVARLKASGLAYSEPGWLKAEDPLTIEIERIIRSPEGVAAAIAAAEAGLPAMAGVDPLLSKALGPDYGGHNHSTLEAGFRVGKVMQSKGYRHSGKAKLPATCVARTAELWVAK